MDPLLAVGLGTAAFVAAIVGGLAGLGSAIIMIPILTFAVGIREAIPIATLSVMMQTWSRVWVNRDVIDREVVKWFLVGAVPAAVLGSVAFANLPATLLQTGLAVFLLVIVAYRHSPLAREIPMRVRTFCPVGVGQGFLSALFGGAGPFGASFFLSYGLRRGAFVGTMASGMTVINVVKVGMYGTYTLLDARGIVIAMSLGIIMIGGAYVGGMLVKRVSDRAFVYIVEAVMVTAAISLLARSGGAS